MMQRSSRSTLRALASAVSACAAIAACRAEPATDDYPAVGAANEAPHDGDVGLGQRRFLYDTWGTEALDQWPTTDFMLGLLHDEPDVFGAQFERFGFVADPNDDLPFGLKRGIEDPTRVHETCAMCHVSRLPDGRLWLGAPNLHLDVGRFRVEVSRRWAAAGHPPLLSPLQEKKALALGPGRFNAETDEYPNLVPADFPAYFQLGRRTHLNYLGTGRNVRTEAYFAIYTFGAGAPNAATARVPFPSDERLAPFLAFFGGLQAPSPPAQDASLVARGGDVFAAARCGSCHHVDDVSKDGVVDLDDGPEKLPGDDPKHPNGTIRTSRLHAAIDDPTSAEGRTVDRGYADLIAFMKAHDLDSGYSSGYRASDLHGLWATAPYLHNGSVPTLEDLLSPAAARPARFDRDGFAVDTTVLGNENVGHEFGTSLSADDKRALVAYLRSL